MDRETLLERIYPFGQINVDIRDNFEFAAARPSTQFLLFQPPHCTKVQYPASDLATAQGFQRKAQFYLDFVEAENSTGFHAPQEAARILGESIDFSRKGQIALRSPTNVGLKSNRRHSNLLLSMVKQHMPEPD